MTIRCINLVNTVNTETYQRSGSGFTAIELPVADSTYTELEAYFSKSFKNVPLLIEVESSINSRGQTLITGFKKSVLN